MAAHFSFYRLKLSGLFPIKLMRIYTQHPAPLPGADSRRDQQPVGGKDFNSGKDGQRQGTNTRIFCEIKRGI